MDVVSLFLLHNWNYLVIFAEKILQEANIKFTIN